MSSSIWDCIVIGAGAAGLVAAERCAARGLKTLLTEKNRKPGVKILISGGTRCNVTYNTDARGIVQAFGRNGQFLHSALARFSPQDLVVLLREEGVRTKVEETGKIFPQSDRAIDVLQALLNRLHRAGARLSLAEAVLRIEKEDGLFQVRTTRADHSARNVIITTGGLSYAGCGTTGDGFVWARHFQHTIVPTVPALTPLTSNDDWVRSLTGLTINDAVVTLEVREPTADRAEADPSSGGGERPSFYHKSKKENVREAQHRGALLFTHFGLSGPAPMNLSRAVSYADRSRCLSLRCDFLPKESAESIFRWLREACEREGRKQLVNIVGHLLPHRLAEALVQRTDIRADKPAAEASNTELRKLCEMIKQSEIHISGTLGFRKAEVTAGGVALEEIDSKTMQSRLCPGLYLAGEVLDLDGPIGGFNFQSAFSTGWLAGTQVEKGD